VPDTLPVHVNRDSLHDVAVPNSFEATGPFTIELTNHGEPLHVHLHLDDTLSQVAKLEAGNHYVEAETTRQVRVEAAPNGSIRGKLKVVAAYGATTRYVDVIVSEPEEAEESVTVDESLNKPQPKPESGSGGAESGEEGLPLTPEAGVVALGVVALFVAAFAVLVLDSTVVVLGALAVLAGVLVAVYLLL
jgi:hypothetical protein